MENDILELQAEWRADPVRCAYDLFADKLTAQQENVLRNVFKYRETYVKSGHGEGKSYISGTTALVFLVSHYPAAVITFAPSWAQVEKILWVEIARLWKNCKIQPETTGWELGGKLLNTELKLSDDWYAIGLSPKIETEDMAKRVTGFHSTNQLIIMDEGPGIDEKIWEISKTLRTGENSRLLAIGNPIRNDGSFFDGFQREGVGKMTLDIFETPNFSVNGVTKIEDLREIAALPIEEREDVFSSFKNPFPALVGVRWAVDRLLEWGEDNPLFQSRVLANWPKIASEGMIDLFHLEKCTNVETTKPSIKVLGVDPARVKDRFVMFGLHNFRECFRSVQPGKDLTIARNEIICEAIQGGYDLIAIEVGGLGVGLYDVLVEAKRGNKKIPSIMPVNFGAGATKEKEKECDNFITELWYRLSKLIESRDIELKDEGTLFSELINRRYGTTKHGLLIIEDKKKYKSRVRGQSPDVADACLTALAGVLFGNPQGSRILRTSERAGGSLDYFADVV